MHTNSVNCYEKPYNSLYEVKYFFHKILILLYQTSASFSTNTREDASNLSTQDCASDKKKCFILCVNWSWRLMRCTQINTVWTLGNVITNSKWGARTVMNKKNVSPIPKTLGKGQTLSSKGLTKCTLCGIVLFKLNTFFSHVFACP